MTLCKFIKKYKNVHSDLQSRQSELVVPPVWSMYDPSGHGVQLLLPSWSAYVSSGQGVHSVAVSLSA